MLNFAKVLDSTKFMEYFSTYVKGYAEDKSWRTRYLFATKIDEFGKLLGGDYTNTKLVSYY